METRMRVPLWGLALLTAGCSPGSALEWTAEPTSSLVLVVPNLDDDDGNGTPDFRDGPNDDDDRALVSVWSKKKRGELHFEGDPASIRVYADGEHVLGAELGDVGTLPPQKGRKPLEIQIEVLASGPIGTLVLDDQRLTVEGVAPTMGHHLLPTEHVWVLGVDFAFEGYSNASMVDRMEEVLGDQLTVIDVNDLDYPDVWVQDEFETFGWWTPDAQGQLALNLPRDGGLDVFVDDLLGAGLARRNVGRPDEAMSADSGGNIEVTPPITVGGVEYPLGRIYYGNYEESYFGQVYRAPQEPLKAYLADAGMQTPIELDTSWLCVGHVDEFMTFLPDPSAPRGFRLFFADVDAGKSLMQAMPADLSLDRYAPEWPTGHGYGTPQEILDDAVLMAFNDDVQADHLDAQLAILRAELELTDEEIVRIPSLFLEEAYEEGVCGALSLIPGTVNLLMVTDETGEGGRAFLPDPFLRTATAGQDADPLISWWKEALPSGITPYFVDDWDVYHMAQGEVHCGSNQTRTPALATQSSLERWTGSSEEAP